MTTEIEEQGLVREHSRSESPHQGYLKSLWFTGYPASTRSSPEAITCPDQTMQHSILPLEAATLLPGNSAISKYLSLASAQADQMTKDLCDNFESRGGGLARRSETEHPWKKTRMTPSEQILGSRESRDQVPVIATIIPVHPHGNPSEELTTTGHHRNLPHDYLNLKVGDGGSLQCEEPNRWGIKRKVDAVTGNTYSDHCEVGQLVPFNFMHSQRSGQWASPPSPATYPTPPELNDLQACTARVFINRKTASCDAVKDPNSSFQDHHSRPLSPPSPNMLKLPKDMQGRWTSDRYKSAQLKLIDIMHEQGAQPGRPIQRPTLRLEARKHIGDTGLLDHLLKHMTDTVVSSGERFRRRHNAEGAMEYWLEEASFMDIRKAAGVEDPSWLPPQGWKPGDKVQGLWEISRGMSSSEAAEMSQLKDNVEILKREINFLVERLKELTQFGILQDTGNVKQPEIAQDAHLTPHDELKKITEEHQAEQQAEQITAVGSDTLEWQLADRRKAISRMRSDVQCILKFLGYEQNEITSSRGSPQAEGFGNGMPDSLLLSTDEEFLSATNVSETLNPASSSRGVVNPHLASLAREFASVKSATTSSADAPTTREIYCVTENPEMCQVKMGGSRVPRDCPCPLEAARAAWLKLTPKSVNHDIPATNNTRWDDYINPSHRDQPGISASTTNSPECSPMPINFPGVVRTLAKDNCPVTAAMAGMFGCMMRANQHPTNKGENPNHVGTDFQHPQVQHSISDSLMAVDYTATSAKKPEKCIIGHDPKIIPAGFDRAFGARQAMITLKPSDNTLPSSHLDPPLSLSLSLTLGSPDRSDNHVGADSIVKSPSKNWNLSPAK